MRERKETQRVSYVRIFKMLLKSVREYKKSSILSFVAFGLQACSDCTIPLLMGFMINEMNDFQTNGGNDTQTIVCHVVMYAVLLVVLAFFSFGTSLWGMKESSKAAAGFAANLRQDLFYKTQDFSFENIDQFSKASLVTRQTTDVTNIMQAYMMILRNGMISPIYFIYSIIASIVVATPVSWIYAVTLPMVAVITVVLIVLALKFFSKAFMKYDNLNKAVEENVLGIRTVKTYSREDFEKQKFNNASEDIRKILTKGEISGALSNPLMNLSINLSMALVVAFGTFAILRGQIKVGYFSILINYAIWVLFALMMLATIMVMVAMSLASMKRVYEVLVEKSTIESNPNALKEIKNGSIEFRNVSFKYKDGNGDEVLKNINLKINSGETVGIIGGTGSAKSTLVNLIPRFYDASEGEILVGETNVKSYDKKALRDEVSMVLQKNVLFSGTIAENIRWGKEDATDEEIQKVCEISQADEFIQQMPDKYQSKVDQGGANFSGGQKQRLCIARALIKKPKILIFDDSTSAVDTKTDEKIREGLKETLPGVTKIIIAQRISSVLHADKIVVLDNGRIDGEGTAKDLYRNNNIFKNVCDLQGVKEEQL